ncbi:MAG: hypothetical protein WC676_02395 [Candidatus Omnitrophota bacterium]
MFKKAISNNQGYVLTVIVLAILPLLLAFSVSSFVVSINNANQTRILFNSLKAEYRAIKGIEYAGIEVKRQAYGSDEFLTHELDIASGELTSVTANGTCPPFQIHDNDLDGVDHMEQLEDCSYARTAAFTGETEFEVKVYQKPSPSGGDNIIYVLSKGMAGGQTKLYINQLPGTSLYNYLGFYPGNVNFGWQTFDAKGGRIHSNNNIEFGSDTEINNVSELSSYGNMYVYTGKSVMPGDENSQYGWRYPYVIPIGYSAANPPPNNATGSYANKEDGYYAGERLGLLVYDHRADGEHLNAAGNALIPGPGFRYWRSSDPNPDPLINISPIYPWDDFNDATSTKPRSPDQRDINGDGTIDDVWDLGSVDRNYIYQEQNVNCSPTPFSPAGACATANPVANNSNFYGYTLRINNTYLPSRTTTPNLLSDSAYGPANYYEQPAYYGHSLSTDPKKRRETFHSEFTPTAWDDLMNNFPIDPVTGRVVNDDGSISITGIYDEAASSPVIKAGPLRGGNYISPPPIDVPALQAEAEESGQGMSIKSIVNDSGETKIRITVNGTPLPNDLDPAQGSTLECTGNSGSVTAFEYKEFINPESGRLNNAVRVDVGKLIECNNQEGQQGRWLPNNGLMSVSDYGVSLKNSSQLPTGGLTTISEENVFLESHYNHWTRDQSASGTTPPASGWSWQPSAIIAAKRVYPVSGGFFGSDLSRLPVPYYHANFPYESTYTDSNGDERTIPAGNGWTATDEFGTFNWLGKYDNLMAPKVDESNTESFRTAGQPADPNYGNYYFDVSLIGPYAHDPRVLERWYFNRTPGDEFTTPPTNTMGHRFAIFTGAFVQLETPSFPANGSIDGKSERRCTDSVVLNDPGGYAMGGLPIPCRTVAGGSGTSAFLFRAANEEKIYQTRYLANTIRPPGNYVGRYQGVLLAIPYTDHNWNYHYAPLG